MGIAGASASSASYPLQRQGDDLEVPDLFRPEGDCWPLNRAAIVRRQSDVHKEIPTGDRFQLRMPINLHYLDQGSDREAAFYIWYQLMTDYSNRSLTKPLDKFPALSGLATAFSNKTKTTYLAGLWKEDFARLVTGPPKLPAKLLPYRAPPWSWAALDSAIFYLPHYYSSPDYRENWIEWAAGSKVEFSSFSATPLGADPRCQLAPGCAYCSRLASPSHIST
jgi:hypothetical protein